MDTNANERDALAAAPAPIEAGAPKRQDPAVRRVAVLLATRDYGSGLWEDDDVWAESLSEDDQDDYLETAQAVVELVRSIPTPTASIEVTDEALVAALNALHGYQPPVTDIAYWSEGYRENIRAGITAAFEEMNR